jgi:hypothetical protein
LQDIHEADARETEPHEAEPVGDRTVAEADRQTAEPPPGGLDEIAAAEAKRAAAEPTGEAGPGAAERGEVAEPGERPGPIAAGGAVGAEPGARLPSAEPALPKGEPVSGAEQPEARAGLGDKPLAPGPADIFGRSESPYLDKAGNIKRTTLGTTDDVWRAVKDAAARNDDFIGDRRGVVTDGMVLDLAHKIGMDGAEQIVKEWTVGRALNASLQRALGTS